MRLCVALFRFWDMREHLTEGRARLETVLRLAGAERTEERARVSIFLGALTTAQGDYPAAERFVEQSLYLYEELGDQSGIAASLNAVAIAARDRGDYQSAQSNFERSLACWRMLADRLAIARCLHNLANVVKVRGDYSHTLDGHCVRRRRFSRNLVIVMVPPGRSTSRGTSRARQGDMAAARALYQRALSAFREPETHGVPRVP